MLNSNDPITNKKLNRKTNKLYGQEKTLPKEKTEILQSDKTRQIHNEEQTENEIQDINVFKKLDIRNSHISLIRVLSL